MAVTGASLAPILQRLNAVEGYHPFEADSFGDWATEAGDVITVSREGTEYSSPLHSTKMVWKGTPEFQLSSTGQQERAPVSKVSRQKYRRGSAAMRSSESIHRAMFDENGYLRSVLDYTESHLYTAFTSADNSIRSELELTESRLRTTFEDDINSLHGYVDQTSSYWHSELEDEANSLRGYVDQTASHWHSELEDRDNSLRGYVDQTASHWHSELEDSANSLHGYVDQTASHWHSELEDEANSLRGYVDQTASHWHSELEDTANSLHGYVDQTASHWHSELEDTANSLHGYVDQTASHWHSELEDTANSLHSEVEQTASTWRSSIEGVVGSDGRVTAATIAIAINEEGSQAVIDADKVYIGNQKSTTVISGKASLNDVTAEYIQSKLADLPTLNGISASFSGNVNVIGGIMASGIYLGSSAPYVSIGSGVRDVRITGPTNNEYKLQYQTYNNSSWKDAGTFSRATTLSGAWASGVFTASASPQGNSLRTSLTNTGHWGNVADNEDPAHFYYQTYATIGNSAVPAPTGNVYEINAASKLLNKTGSNKFTANGSYSAEEGYIGYGDIVIDVPQSGGADNVDVRFSGSSGSYFVEAFDSVSGDPFLGANITYKLGRSGNNVRIEYPDNTQIPATPTYAIPLDSTRTLTSNGTYAPTSGKIGMSEVYVNVPSDMPNARARFGVNSNQYYIQAYDNVSGTAVTGSNVSYKLGLSGTTVQMQNMNSAKLDYTPTLSIPLDSTRTLTSNGTYAPTSGKIGIQNVVVNVPSDMPNARAKFGQNGSQYYIQAYDNVSGTAVTGSNVSYKLGLSGTTVQMQNMSSAKLDYTPTLSIPLDSTRTLTSNGSYSPTSGKVGIQKVVVNVPSDLPKAKARFNSGSSQYYIEAYDRVSGNAINDSSITYKMGISGRYVQLHNSSNSRINSTPQVQITSVASIDYNSSTHKYTSTSVSKVGDTSVHTVTKASGTEAYDAGYTDSGLSINGASATSGKNTVVRVKSSSIKSVTISATASLSYNSSTHKYTAIAKSFAGGTEMGGASYTGGTEAYSAGVTNGKNATGLVVSGNSASSNKNTVRWSDSNGSGTRSVTISAVASISYNSSTHKYTASALSKAGSTEMGSATKDGGTEAYDAGKSDAESAAGLSINGASASSNKNTVVVTKNSSTKKVTISATAAIAYNSSTHKYTATAKSFAGNTEMGGDSTTGGTQAYDAGVTAGRISGATDAGNSAWFNYTSTAGSSSQSSFIEPSVPGTERYLYIFYNDANGNRVNKTNTTWYLPKPDLFVVDAQGASHQGDLTPGSYICAGYHRGNYGADAKFSAYTWRVPPKSTASYSFSGMSVGGPVAADQISQALQGYTMHFINATMGNASPNTRRYVKFSVDGKKHAFYFS